MENEIREHPEDERDDGPAGDEGAGRGEGHASGGDETVAADGRGAPRGDGHPADGHDSGDGSAAVAGRDDGKADGGPRHGAPDDEPGHDQPRRREEPYHRDEPAAAADPVDGDPEDAAEADAGSEAGSPAGPEPELPAYEREPVYDEASVDYAETAAAASAASAAAVAADPGDPSGEASFGTWLRRQREMREIDLRRIAEQTKISLRYLKAMEQDRFDVLPAPVFARGFLREYSRYVGLNPDEVVNYYLATHEGADLGTGGGVEEPVSISTASRGPVSKRFLVLLIAILLAAVAVYAYFYQRSKASREEAQPPPIAAPASLLGELPPEPVQDLPADGQAAPLVVTLDFTQRCWVEVEVDRSRRTSRLFVAGESLQLEAEEVVVLETLGNAGGVEVQVNGEPFEIPGADGGQPVRDVVIDRARFAPATTAPSRGGGTSPPARTTPAPSPQSASPPPATTGGTGTGQAGAGQEGTGQADTGEAVTGETGGATQAAPAGTDDGTAAGSATDDDTAGADTVATEPAPDDPAPVDDGTTAGDG